MSNLHKSWVEDAVAKGLARFEDATVTIKDVPNKGDKQEVPFKKVVFTLDGDGDVSTLWTLAEDARGTTKDDDGNEVPAENAINTLLTYAYGLNCRAKVRVQYESQFEDPEKAVKKIAEALVKSGRFKSFDKALAAAKLLQETEDDE